MSSKWFHFIIASEPFFPQKLPERYNYEKLFFIHFQIFLEIAFVILCDWKTPKMTRSVNKNNFHDLIVL